MHFCRLPLLVFFSGRLWFGLKGITPKMFRGLEALWTSVPCWVAYVVFWPRGRCVRACLCQKRHCWSRERLSHFGSVKDEMNCTDVVWQKRMTAQSFFRKNDDAFVVHIFSRQRRPLWLRVCPQPANQNFCWRQPGSLVTSHDFTDVQRTCSDPAWFLCFKSPFAAPNR